MPESSSQTVPSSDYKKTLNLPQTTFKMKAGAATREVEIESYWETEQVYERMLSSSKSGQRFLLHDGPPYLSASTIHIGTALNKILKDIVTRYKSQQGFYTPYVPGYDGHGLPIENAVVKTLKGGRHSITQTELRKRCREFALKNLAGQEKNFRRLGVWGNWKNPYITIDAAFEAEQIRLFGELYEKQFIYKGLKPVYWCSHCETALADAEVEYDDKTSHSIYVAFKTQCLDAVQLPDNRKAALKDASLVIWTTTPWTLPANMALAVHPDLTYVLVETVTHGKLLVAEGLLANFTQEVLVPEASENASLPSDSAMPELTPLCHFLGWELEGLITSHPFIDRGSPVLLGGHVTLDAGTGIVHTAPGHGMEDYLVVQEYNRTPAYQAQPISIHSPLDNKGCFTPDAAVESITGLVYHQANAVLLDILKNRHALLAHSTFSHSYPHCWRCHQPVIYRATEQWFIDIEKARQPALTAIQSVNWIPERGETRISNMVSGRGDWCLSRQRVWGVPIPVFYDAVTQEVVITPEIITHISRLFEQHTSDIWWEATAEELLKDLPEAVRTRLNLDNRTLKKEMDIMDVWFDSGMTHRAVVDARSEELGHSPAELYLEGSDQHRGWFQSSLLTSVMSTGKAPYRNVLTHGFVLDESGRKMSKSLGNVVDPNSVIQEYGADVLRLWVASVDYTNDVRIGKNTLHQMAEIYKKVRNTIRFILGNLADFNPLSHSVPYASLSLLDQYTLHRLQHITGNITDAFERWEFYRYAHEIQYLAMVDLSALYFDITKDILYCDSQETPRRRAVQTVLFEVLKTMLPMLVPVTPHLAEDIWLSLPAVQQTALACEELAVNSAVLLKWPMPQPQWNNSVVAETINRLLEIKSLVNQALEEPRSKGEIGSSLEARVIVVPANLVLLEQLTSLSPEFLSVLFITSSVVISAQPPVLLPQEKWVARAGDTEVAVIALPTTDNKCGRCWKYETSVGQDTVHPELCSRCQYAVVVGKTS
jgi:isoleucyl-tRNA synthetase